MHDIVHTEKSLTLVFEYLERDLKQYMDDCGGILAMNNVKVKFIQYYTPKKVIMIIFINLNLSFCFIAFSVSIDPRIVLLPFQTNFTQGSQATKPSHKWYRRIKGRKKTFYITNLKLLFSTIDLIDMEKNELRITTTVLWYDWQYKNWFEFFFFCNFSWPISVWHEPSQFLPKLIQTK